MRKQFFARQKYFKSMIIKSIKGMRNDEIKYLIVKIRIAKLSCIKNYSIMLNNCKQNIQYLWIYKRLKLNLNYLSTYGPLNITYS